MISIATRLRPFKTWQSVPLLRPWTPTTTSTSRPSPTQPSSTHRFQLSIRRMSVWFAYLFIHLSILSLSFIPTLFNISFSALEYRHGLPIYLYIYIFINYVFPLTSPLMLITMTHLGTWQSVWWRFKNKTKISPFSTFHCYLINRMCQ